MRHAAIFSLSVSMMASTANAHPGHGAAEAQQGLLHYVLSPLHATPWLMGVATLVIAATVLGARRRARIAIRRDESTPSGIADSSRGTAGEWRQSDCSVDRES